MPQFNMPQLGETVTEGTITRWLKQEGESVEADEALLEVSTDKVDSEIPAPHAGTVAKILAGEGETVAIGAPIAEISSADEAPVVPASEQDTAAADAALEPAAGEADVAQTSQPAGPITHSQAPQERKPAIRVLSPLVRKLAAQTNVDLSAIEGTGTAGRITREDVLRHAAGGNGAAAGAPSGSPARAKDGPPPAGGPRSSRPETTVARTERGAEEKVPLTNMRRLIAEHMVASVNETARAWNTVEVDMTSIGKLRKAAVQSFKATTGISLTWTPFVAKALTQALLQYPQVNSSWNGDSTITKKHYVNLGIAVALDNGLIVPVIKGADQMSLLGLAGAIKDLAERARSKKLTADEIKEGTFTLTNPGPFGSIMSVPIINRGEAAILAFDAIVKRPVVVSAADGSDSIAIREMVYLSLSWDHRLIDGAEAAQFLSRLKRLLEEADFKNDLAPYLP